jgi:predicted acylesterase/phospholipase RssA
MSFVKNKRIGLSLPGAGVRGVAYVGVLQAIEEAGIEIARIITFSSGAIVSILYAQQTPFDEITEIFRGFKWRNQLRRNWLRKNFLEGTGGKRLEDLTIPIHIQVANFSTHQNEIISQGPIVDWLLATSNINFYQPISINQQKYIDGGFSAGYGVSFLRQYEDVSTIVTVSPGNPSYDESMLKNPIFPMQKLATFSLTHIRELDKIVNPPDIHIPNVAEGYGVFDSEYVDEMVEKGYQATKKEIPNILAFLKNH